MTPPPPILIFSRLDSSRLPEKALKKILGVPMVTLVIRNMLQVRRSSGVILCTTDRPIDDVLERLAHQEGIPVYRGDLLDVASRALDCCRAFEIESFVRVSGDSPLLPPEIVETAIGIFSSGRFDVVSNVYPVRSFPKGMSVEVLRKRVLEEIYEELSEGEREHIMDGVYRAHEARRGDETLFPQIRIGAMVADGDFSETRFVVDTSGDLENVRKTAREWVGLEGKESF